MADPKGPLAIYRARLAELLASIDRGNADLRSIHAELSQSIIADLRKLGTSRPVNAAKLQEQFDAAFAKSLPKRVRIARERIEEGAKAGRRAAQQTIRATLGEQTTQAHVRATAKSLSEAGERIAGRVTVDGKSLVKRMRGVDREVAEGMAREVQGAIRGQRGILGAARQIEKLDPRSVEMPKYLRELEAHARAGNVDQVKKLAAKYQSRIAGLGEVQQDGTRKASKYSVRKATKDFVSKVEKAGADGIDGIVGKYVEDRAAYRANVIARSESVEAMRQSYVQQAKNKPGVWGFKWTLSNRHANHEHGGSREDVCDVLAHANMYKLGPGIYPAEHVPRMPHPGCLCTAVAQMRRDVFDLEESQQNEPPDSAKLSKAPDAVGWLKQNDAAAAKILGPTRHAMLKAGRTDVVDATGRPRLVRDLLQPDAKPQVMKMAVGQSPIAREPVKPVAPKPKLAPTVRTKTAADKPPPPVSSASAQRAMPSVGFDEKARDEFRKQVTDAVGSSTGKVTSDVEARVKDVAARVEQTLGLKSTRPVSSVVATGDKRAYMHWDGRMEVDFKSYGDASFETVIHESIHTMGGAQKKAYFGAAANIEEAVTEELTHKLLGHPWAKTAAVPAKKLDLSDAELAYKEWQGAQPTFIARGGYFVERQRVMSALSSATGETDPQKLSDRFQRAAQSWKKNVYDNPEQAVKAFSLKLAETPEERQFFQRVFSVKDWNSG